MILPDTNLLLYAHEASFPLHAEARRWWESLLNSDTPVGLASVVVFGFVRIATSTRVFPRPMRVEDALRRAEAWLARPNVSRLDPGPRHVELAFALLRGAGTAGNLTTDAQLAALALEHGAEVHTSDADFLRFPDVRWRNPLAPPPRRRR